MPLLQNLDSLSDSTVTARHLELLLRKAREDAGAPIGTNWARWGLDPLDETGRMVAKQARKNGLSGYALKDARELVAESFAQLYDGSVSEAAREVLRVMLKHSTNIDLPDNALLKRRLEEACS